MTDIEKLKAMIEAAYIYIPYDSEALLINYWDHETQLIHATGEDSGDEIQVEYEDIDLKRDMFYSLKLLNPDLKDVE